MNNELFREEKTTEFEGRDNPVSARVIELVSEFPTETGAYLRQTHSKDGTHYVAAYNPHEGKDHAAECFVSADAKFRWIAVNGPAEEDIGQINSILDAFEGLI